jgi:hypothetical protein
VEVQASRQRQLADLALLTASKKGDRLAIGEILYKIVL